MDKLSTTIIQHIYDYDSTYKVKFDKMLLHMNMHCCIYRCSECFKPYNQCFCYCQTCGTYLRFCEQLYFKDGDMTEEDIIDITGLGLRLIICFVQIILHCITYDGRNNFKIIKGD